MKKVLIIVAVVVLLGSVAFVQFAGGGTEDLAVPNHQRSGGSPGRGAAPPIGRPPKKLIMGNGGGGGGTSFVAKRELVNLLDHYRRAFSKERKHHVVVTLQSRMFKLRDAMRGLLQNHEHDYLVEAIEVAGRLREKALRSDLAVLAKRGPEKHRPRAVLAADSAGPWSKYELETFLSQQSEALVIAALTCVEGRREDRPTLALIRLLGCENDEIRRRVVRAMPGELTYEERDRLLSNIDQGTELAAHTSMRVLARMKIDPEIEKVLVGRLDSSSRDTRILALELLATKGSPLTHADKVWRPASLFSRDENEQARVLFCLESTNSFELDAIKDSLSLMSPLVRYMGARCLITAGDKSGVSELLDLLEELRESELKTEGADSRSADVLRATRMLLGQLSRTGQYSTFETWQVWFEGLEKFVPRRLGAPPIDFK